MKKRILNKRGVITLFSNYLYIFIIIRIILKIYH
jgi:hypothetical protein